MIEITEEITKEAYDKAKEKGVYSLFSVAMLMGYGVYGASVTEEDGKYYLTYSKGSSCD